MPSNCSSIASTDRFRRLKTRESPLKPLPNSCKPSEIAYVDRLTALLEMCYNDPDLFNELFIDDGKHFWSRQKEICESVVKYRTTVVYSGNMVGKDFVLGRLIWWWLYTRPRSLVVVTGPTQRSVGTVLWGEVRRAQPRAIQPGSRISQSTGASPQLVDFGDGWQAMGFSTTTVERASGLHNPDLLAIIDEASGVEEEMVEAIDSLGYERLVAIGNPIRAEGKFVDLIRQADRDRADNVPPRLAINAIRIPSTESPHAHLEKSEFGLADRTWLESMYRKYGKGSLWVGSHIEARIPDVDAEQLIPVAWLDYHRSEQRPQTPPNHPVHSTRRIACDLSEGVGRDSTCIVVLDDWGMLQVVLSNSAGLPEAAETIHRLSIKWNVPHERISFDKLGIGRNFPNHLARWGITTAVPYAGEGRPQDPGSFSNLRTEAAWKLRNRLDATHMLYQSPGSGRPAQSVTQRPFYFCSGEYYARLVEELRPLTYELVGRKTKLMSKDDWATILGHSPDVADALIQSMIFQK